MALDARALTTVAIFETEMSISDTTVSERLIHAASDAIARHLDRTLHNATGIVEKLAGYGGPRIILARAPIVSITSITENGSTVASADYSIEDSEGGILYKPTGWDWAAQRVSGITQPQEPGTEDRNITVTYAGGWVTPAQAGTRTLPADIEEACLLTAISLYRQRGRDRGVSSESVGGASIGYDGLNTGIGRGLGGIIPDAAVTMLRPYRRIV